MGLAIPIGGDWSLQHPAPSFDELVARFGPDPRPPEVRFSMEHLGTYDSSLISLQVQVAKRCQADQIELNPDGFPEGVRRRDPPGAGSLWKARTRLTQEDPR